MVYCNNMVSASIAYGDGQVKMGLTNELAVIFGLSLKKWG